MLLIYLLFYFFSAYLIKTPCLLSYNLFETEALCYLGDYTNFLFNALKLKAKKHWLTMKSTLMLYPHENIKTLNFTSYETQSLQKVAGYIPQAKPAVISNCYEQILVQHFSKLKHLQCLQSNNMHAKYFCITV